MFLHIYCLYFAYFCICLHISFYIFMHIFAFNVHILCIWLLIPAYKSHIYAYFIAYACILLLIQYLFLHILCMFLHICCLYHAYSCIVSMHIFAYLNIFCHFVAYLSHIHAFVCIFEHILILTMQHSPLMLLQSYILDNQDIAQEFTYHHRLPSPSPGFESQDPPSKSAASPLML